MKERSLRTACSAGTVSAALLLAWAGPADAHFRVDPGAVTAGTVEFLVELPAAYEPVPGSVRLEGSGVETLSSVRAASTAGEESRWTVSVRIDAPAGPLPVAVRAAEAGGGSFTLRTSLIVVPAERSGGLPWVAAAVAAALGLGVAVAVLARRRA